jgi:hypothetical protein
LYRVTGYAACFSRNLIKIELLCSWRAVVFGHAADLSFENDDNVDKYLGNITLQEILLPYSISQCHMIM